MNLTDRQKEALCCILLDMAKTFNRPVDVLPSPRLGALTELTQITSQDFVIAGQASVLTSLVVIKELHYKVKMLIGLIACEYYSACDVITLEHRALFDMLMSTIDWKMSFPEMMKICRSQGEH